MAAKIQVARGDISGKQVGNKKLVPAELFWQARTSDENNKNSSYTKWDEGTLYIGRPSLNLDKTEEQPIPIAGARTHFAVVHRGFLSNETSIQNEIFKHARIGDLYVWSNDAIVGQFNNVDDFRKDDLLLITDVGGEGNISKVSGDIYDQSLIKYTRINSSGGYADDVYFTQDGKEDGTKWPQFESTNVQDALLELQYEKLEYCGTIGAASQIPVVPKIGGLYLIVVDQLTFNSRNLNQGAVEFSPDKGDFVYWKQPVSTAVGSGYWVQIPSGYTNADEIDYYDYDDDKDYFISQLYTTFNEAHISEFKSNSNNVKQMLDFLMARKAQLDEQGKIPLSQLHDTVLGALQFRGVWNPLKENVDVNADLRSEDGKHYVKEEKAEEIVNPLPGLVKYSFGDTTETDREYTGLNDGDYYYVQCQADILNLQYNFHGVNFELNTGDWLVWQSSPVQDNVSPGTQNRRGFWSKLDNTDRLTAMQYVIDVQNRDNFFVTHEIDESILTLVGTPRLKGQNKIGLENLGNNTVGITGRGLIDQIEYENPLPNFLPRYEGVTGTLKNSFIEEIGGEHDTKTNRTDFFKDVSTTNLTRFHSNVDIGDVNEVRFQRIFGNVIIKPHITQTLDTTTFDKSLLQFEVVAADDSGDLQTRTVSLVAANGLSAAEGYGVNEDISDIKTNIILPEHTSTLIGKLAGIEFNRGRILKSVEEGYAESTSIEEHINNGLNDSNNHDGIENIVEFHSKVSIPITNSYEYYFGDWNTSPSQNGYYDADDFKEDGTFSCRWKSNILNARLVKNTYQTATNITVMLPVDSGTLITEEYINTLFGQDDDTYLTMFGESKTLATGNRINTLQKSPLRQIQNALKTRLAQAKVEKDQDEQLKATQYEVSQRIADIYAKMVADGMFRSTTDVANSDTVVENDLIAGKFDDNGNLIEKKSIFGTKAIGVADPAYGTFVIHGARQNFPDAEQYYDPVTGRPTLPIDVVVDAPNESGVLLTSNSVISGGLFNIAQ